MAASEWYQEVGRHGTYERHFARKNHKGLGQFLILLSQLFLLRLHTTPWHDKANTPAINRSPSIGHSTLSSHVIV